MKKETIVYTCDHCKKESPQPRFSIIDFDDRSFYGTVHACSVECLVAYYTNGVKVLISNFVDGAEEAMKHETD